MRTTSGMSDISGDSERRPLVGLVGRIGWDDDTAWRCTGHEGVGHQDPACSHQTVRIRTRRHRDHRSGLLGATQGHTKESLLSQMRAAGSMLSRYASTRTRHRARNRRQ